MAGALDGVMVLDLTTHLSGPFCGMQLGDLGADVVKIESPQGDSMRGTPPFLEGESAPFMLWNRNKRGLRLDLKNADDLETFWGLVDQADVMLENFRLACRTLQQSAEEAQVPPAITHDGVTARYMPALTTSSLLTCQYCP